MGKRWGICMVDYDYNDLFNKIGDHALERKNIFALLNFFSVFTAVKLTFLASHAHACWICIIFPDPDQ